MVGFDGITPPPELKELIRDYHVGGVILYRRNIKSAGQLIDLIEEIKNVAEDNKLLIAVDHEGGRVFRMPPPFTQFVPMGKIGKLIEEGKDIHTAYEIGKKMAEELKGVGINVNFAPVLDVNTDIKNPVIGDRSFSSSPKTVSKVGVELIKGLQENGIIACGKHFPGHGDTFLDSHFSLPSVPHTIGRLESLELIPFIAAITAGVKSLMTAHVIYEGIDRELPATLSPILINKLLRKELGYDGVVFTDDLNMHAISKKWSVNEACVMSLKAGCDICLISRDNKIQKEALEYTINAATSGRLQESIIDMAYRRVSRLI